MNWQSYVSVLWLEKGSPSPTQANFLRSKDGVPAEDWCFAAEAFGYIYGYLASGAEKEPWVLWKGTDEIDDVAGVKSRWTAWCQHVNDRASLGKRR